MANEKEFSIKLTINGVDTSVKTLGELKTATKQLQAEIAQTDMGSAKYKELTAQLRESKSAVRELDNDNKSIKESFMSLPGPIGGVIRGLDGVDSTMWKIVKNPIGAIITAIVLALTGLVKLFTSTQAGADKVEIIMAKLSATVNVLKDRTLKLFDAFSSLFSGNFREAAQKFKDTVSGIGEEIANDAKDMGELTKRTQELDDAERALKLRRSEVNAQLAEAKATLSDTNASLADRQKALNEIRMVEGDLAKDELQFHKDRLDNEQAIYNLKTDHTDEEEDRLNSFKVAYNDAKKSQADTERTFNRLQKQLNAEDLANSKQTQKEKDDDAKLKRDDELAYMEEVFAREEELMKQSEEVFLQIRQGRMTEQEKELDNLEINYLKQKDILIQAGYDTLELTEQFEKDKQTIRDKYAKEQKEKELERVEEGKQLSEDILKSKEDEFANQLQIVNEYYDYLAEKANGNAVELIRIAEERAKVEAEIERAKTNFIIDQYSMVAESLISIFGKSSKVGKAVALFQIGLDTAKAISSLMVASEANPSNAVTFGGAGIAQFAAGLARIFANVAMAKKIISGSGDSTSQSGTGDKPKGGKYYTGGLFQGIGGPIDDMNKIAISPGEFIMNAAATSQFLPVLQQMNDKYRMQGTPTATDSTQVTPVTTNQQPQIIKAYVVSGDITTAQEKEKLLKDLSKF